jgi:hypothetical protein
MVAGEAVLGAVAARVTFCFVTRAEAPGWITFALSRVIERLGVFRGLRHAQGNGALVRDRLVGRSPSPTRAKIKWEAAAMNQLAQEIAALAHRDDPQTAAREVIAKSGHRAAAEIAWAILTAVAKAQAKTEPPRRITWRPSQIRRRR